MVRMNASKSTEWPGGTSALQWTVCRATAFTTEAWIGYLPMLATALMTVNRIGLQPMLFPALSRQRQTWQSSWVNIIVYSIKLVALERLLWYSLIGGTVCGACFADELSLD